MARRGHAAIGVFSIGGQICEGSTPGKGDQAELPGLPRGRIGFRPAPSEVLRLDRVSPFVIAGSHERIEYGKLLLAAKVGELCPAEKGGRGKLRSPTGGFHEDTLTDYRNLARYQADGLIDAHFRAGSSQK